MYLDQIGNFKDAFKKCMVYGPGFCCILSTETLEAQIGGQLFNSQKIFRFSLKQAQFLILSKPIDSTDKLWFYLMGWL